MQKWLIEELKTLWNFRQRLIEVSCWCISIQPWNRQNLWLWSGSSIEFKCLIKQENIFRRIPIQSQSEVRLLSLTLNNLGPSLRIFKE